MAGNDNVKKDEVKSVDPTDTRKKPKQKTIRVETVNGLEDVSYYPAPRHDASASVTRLHAKGRDQQLHKTKITDIPDSATPEAKATSNWRPMPAGGLTAVIDEMWPEDADNEEAFDQHLQDLMLLNNDILRNESSHMVGQHIRVPKV